MGPVAFAGGVHVRTTDCFATVFAWVTWPSVPLQPTLSCASEGSAENEPITSVFGVPGEPCTA